MLKNKKGFTLVELLAVIVILAIILAIAIPSITGIIGTAKTGAFESDVKMIIKGIEYNSLEASTNGTTNGTTELPTAIALTEPQVTALGADFGAYTSITITSKNPVTVTVIAKSTSEFGAKTCTACTRSSITITNQ